MAQDLTVNIKTTSDVPQAMDRAKTATVSFGKQVDDIQKKFSMAFKDVFLSFLGPLALLGIAMNYIGKLIDENRKKQEDANQAAIDGTNALMSAEDKYWANKRNNEQKATKETEQAAVTRETVTKEFMIFDRERAFDAMSKEQQAAFLGGTSMNDIAKDPEYQKKIQALIAEDMKKNPSAGAPIDASKQANFKGPEGFSNVIGVGSNPVMESMRSQLLETQRTNALLEQIVQAPAGTDFTKSSSPSRAAQLLK
jgi:hypothetical protein